MTKTNTLNKIINICNSEGWSVYEGAEDLEISKHSPAGEDFFFTVEKENALQNIIDYANEFDPDEHAEMWIEYRGTRGVPESVRELIDDADEIAEMLNSLAYSLRGLNDEQ